MKNDVENMGADIGDVKIERAITRPSKADTKANLFRRS